jgi:hypothetical protein
MYHTWRGSNQRRARKGNRYLRRMLIQNAWAVAHKKDCFLTGLFYRVATRRGMKRAAMAVAHKILMFAFYIIRDGSVYREVGGDYFDRLHPERTARRLTQRLQRIGYEVVLTARPAAAPVAGDTPQRRGHTQDSRIDFRSVAIDALGGSTTALLA